jgi:hypothetical protein
MQHFWDKQNLSKLSVWLRQGCGQYDTPPKEAYDHLIHAICMIHAIHFNSTGGNFKLICHMPGWPQEGSTRRAAKVGWTLTAESYPCQVRTAESEISCDSCGMLLDCGYCEKRFISFIHNPWASVGDIRHVTGFVLFSVGYLNVRFCCTLRWVRRQFGDPTIWCWVYCSHCCDGA